MVGEYILKKNNVKLTAKEYLFIVDDIFDIIYEQEFGEGEYEHFYLKKEFEGLGFATMTTRIYPYTGFNFSFKNEWYSLPKIDNKYIKYSDVYYLNGKLYSIGSVKFSYNLKKEAILNLKKLFTKFYLNNNLPCG